MNADLPKSRPDGRGEAQRFGLFVVAGGIAAAANCCSRFGVGTSFKYPVAIACAYLSGMAVAPVVMCRREAALLSRLSRIGVLSADPAASAISVRLLTPWFAILRGVRLLTFTPSGEAATACDSRA